MNQLLKAYVFISSLNSERNCNVNITGKTIMTVEPPCKTILPKRTSPISNHLSKTAEFSHK